MSAATAFGSVFLSTNEAAAQIRLAAQTLRLWRSMGLGPPFVKLGAGRSCRCVYRKSDLEAWLKAHTHGDPGASQVDAQAGVR